jgi:hypothetical protein
MSEPLVCVETFDVAANAATAQALLESAGIEVRITDLETTSLNFLWAGWTGGIKLNVPASQAAAARALLREMRESNRRLAKTDYYEPLASNCLQCGFELDERAPRCPKCGWSFEGEDRSEYANGPVPHSLLRFAWSPLDSKSFALPMDVVPRYVRWCESEHLRITGWEVWQRSPLSHRVVARADAGDSASLLAAVASARAEYGEETLICVRTAPDPAAEGGMFERG